jgi:hypothetical protein
MEFTFCPMSLFILPFVDGDIALHIPKTKRQITVKNNKETDGGM